MSLSSHSKFGTMRRNAVKRGKNDYIIACKLCVYILMFNCVKGIRTEYLRGQIIHDDKN